MLLTDETSRDGDDGDEADDDQPPAPPSPAVDWQREAEEYKNRFTGLQRRVQQEVETRRQLEQRLAANEQASVQAQIAQLPEEQQPYAMYALQLDLQKRQMAAQTQQLQEERLLEQDALTVVLKERKVQKLMEAYPDAGLDPAALSRFPDPDSMEQYAKDIAAAAKASGRAATNRERRAAGSDTFEGGGSPTSSRKAPSTYDDSREVLRQFYAGRGSTRRRSS
jgi:hypothetical protein